jgi:hypothetical protein
MNAFISYSHRDREWCERLFAHLQGISKDVISEVWYDKRISPGSNWDAEIQRRLNNAEIVILLISENFLNAPFCPFEVERALQLREAKRCIIIPVLLSYCLYASLGLGTTDSSPHGGKPIASDDWPDKALALATVAREVENVARARLGKATRRKGLAIDHDTLTKLLHLHCDRTPQRTALHEALVSKGIDPQRPFVMVVYGHAADCLDWYLFRLRHVLLKRYFQYAICELTPLLWPEAVRKVRPFDAFCAGLSDSLSVSPFASITEMNRALHALCPLSLLPTFIPAHRWGKVTESVFLSYLQLWQEWPQLPADRLLMPTVLIEYQDREDLNPRILRFLKQLHAQGELQLRIATLPGLEKVHRWEIQQWLKLNEVKECLPEPENAMAKSYQLEDTAFRMYDWAETYLPRFLGTL